MDVEPALELVVAGREVVVHGVAPTTTLADLALAGGLGHAPRYVVDGRWHDAAATLVSAGVRRGSELGGDAAAVAGASMPRWHTGGRAGFLDRLAPAPGAVDAPNGEATVATGPGLTPWTQTINRPPRRVPATDDTAVPITPPPPPVAYESTTSASSVLPAVVSAAGAVVAAVVFRQPLWLLLSGLGLVASLTSRAQQRRRDRRAAARARVQGEAATAMFAASLIAAHAAAERVARTRPDAGVAFGAACRGSSTMWERRPDDADGFVVTLGCGDLPWAPTITGGVDPAAALADTVVPDRLRGVPVPLALRPGTIVGMVGPRAAARALARAVVCEMAVHHGPRDVRIAAAGRRAAPWAWVHWLPHARAPDDGPPLVAAGDADADRMLAALAVDGAIAAPMLLLVVDDAALAAARTAHARATLAGAHGPVAGIVLAERLEQLPASCTHVVELDAGGDGVLRPVRGGAAVRVQLAGATASVATRVARSLARFDDPDAPLGAAMPDAVGLVELVGAAALDAEALADAWARLPDDVAPRAPVARAADGVVELDLGRDGPHALVAGTTGSGKSELLRTWIAALAVRCRPSDLTFVLVDYKGGAAFDACGALPHVVGLVTDLDDELAERALVSLEAEVRRRERLLRALRASDLAAYRRAAEREPLPRLVVVVDEFAALAAELPGFLHALVDVARRGRSLGIHLVLATQRPGTAVSDDVRANTNLRLSLRVQEVGDSLDVVGDGLAARLPRDRPGRVVVRLGAGELVVAQAGHGGIAAGLAAGVDDRRRLHVVEWRAVPAPLRAPCASVDHSGSGAAPTELDAVVAAVRGAADRLGTPEPRRPWLPPLPCAVELPALPGGALGLVDEPARQRQRPLEWSRETGNLLVCGSVSAGDGAGAALVAPVLAAACDSPPDALHVYVVDAGACDALAGLTALAHVGAVVRVDDLECIERLVRRLSADVDRRRADMSGARPQLLVVDGLATLRTALDDPRRPEVLELLDGVLAEGPSVGVQTIASIDRLAALPTRVLASFAHRWTACGCEDQPARAATAGRPSGPPGRFIVDGGLLAQVAVPASRTHVEEAVLAIAAHWPAVAPGERAQPVRRLPEVVPRRSLAPPVLLGDAWHVPIGLDDGDVAPVTAVLRPGDHLLVAGPPRSGRTATLRLFAAAHANLWPDRAPPLYVTGAGPPTTSHASLGLWTVVSPERAGAAIAATAPALVLVDDAERLDDVDGTLAALITEGNACVVAAGHAEALRGSYGHWTRLVRRSRAGLLLRPHVDTDGDLLGVVLPRRPATRLPPGRGYYVADGEARLVQVATVDDAVGAAPLARSRSAHCVSCSRSTEP